jgi:hypothetical protein
MPRESRHTFRGYRLISTYLKLQQQEALDRAYDEAFDRRLKGFHVFCVILFSAFLIDGLLPLRQYPSQITGVKVVDRQQLEVNPADKKNRSVQVSVPVKIVIGTTEGSFTTSQVTGYEEPGTPITVEKTFLFRARERIHYKASGSYAYHYINFHGNFIIWPLISLLMSLTFVASRRFYGSNTLSVLALLNLVPFFSVLYIS